MKKRKIKLFASVASLAMVAAVMGVGVWAASQQAVNINSTIQFSGSNIAATVKLQVAGVGDQVTSAMYDDTNYTATPAEQIAKFNKDHGQNADSEAKQLALALADVDSGDGMFTEGSKIVYTFTITNDDAATSDITVAVTATLTAAAAPEQTKTAGNYFNDPTITINDAPYTSGAEAVQFGANATVVVTYEAKANITDFNTGALGTIGITLNYAAKA